MIALRVLLIPAMLLFAGAAVAAPASPKRELPDYGDGDEPASREGAASWIARVVLWPFYAVNEYLARRPLALLVPFLERHEIPRRVYDAFSLEDPNHEVGVVPVGFVDFGFAPSIGIYAFADDAFVQGHSLRLHLEVWPDGTPTQWLAGSLTDAWTLGAGRKITVRAAAVKRPDMMFFGIGPSTRESHKSRYAIAKFDVSAALATPAWRSSTLTGSVGVRKTSTHDGHLYGDPTVSQGVADGYFEAPRGFDTTYSAPYVRADAVLDTRPRGTHGSGMRAELHGEEASDVERVGSFHALRYGAAVTGLYDVNAHGRVLALTVATLFTDPLTHAPAPFTELPTLGGDNPMPGFFAGRLVDRSAAVVTLKYDWPIAPVLSGTLQASAGNVFGAHLEEIAPMLARVSFAVGLSTMSFGDQPFELLVGLGTETLRDGAKIDSVRVAVGVPQRF